MSNENFLRKYTCQICDKILLKPFLLPCSVCRFRTNICKEHLNDLFIHNPEETLFECKKCETKFNLLRTDIKENSQLNLQLKRHVYLSNTKLKLKLELETKLDEIERYLVNLKEVEVKEYSMEVYDYFFALRNEVDIKRETVLEKIHQNKKENQNKEEEIEQINHMSSNLIEQIDLTESEFHKNFTNEIEYNIMGVIYVQEEKRQLNERLRNTSLRENDLRDLKRKYETKLDIIQNKPIKFEEKFKKRLKENKFREYNGVKGSYAFHQGNLIFS
jgi:hypothetical protein